MTKDRTAFVHIGLHKTGTTAIQVAFHAFSNDTLVVPNLGRDPNHSIPLVNTFMTNTERYHINKYHGRSKRRIKEMRKSTLSILEDVLTKDRRNILLSGEDLRFLPPDDLSKMKRWLSEYVDHIQIIVFVRDPVSYCVSGFAEDLKHGALEFDFPMPNFRIGLEKFTKVFGKDAITLECHRPKEKNSIEVIADIVSVEPPDQTRDHANTSFSLEASRVLYSICALVADRNSADLHRVAKDLRRYVADMGSKKVVLARELVEPELDFADLDWLEKEFSVTFEIEQLLSALEENCTIRSVEDLHMTDEDREFMRDRLSLSNTSDDAFLAFAKDVMRKENTWKKYAQPVERKLKRILLGR